jgi:hypothetical protein
MSTTRIACDAKLVVGGKASGMLGEMGKMLSREAVISGYGAISDTDVGFVATHVYDGLETLRSFNAPALAEEAKHSAFSVFRDAIADAAESPTQLVANGENFTNFYTDLLDGHKSIEADILVSAPDSVDAKLNYAELDWNDPAARAEYLKNIQEYSQQTGLRDHLGFSEGRMGSSSDELKILLHTASKEEYGAYIQQFEHAIQENFTQQLTEAQEQARQLGYTGSMNNVRAMEKFAATLGDADKGAMQHLIQLTDGKINKVDQYILARISDGQININEVLNGDPSKGIQAGYLNGVKLDDKALRALAALNVFANSDNIANAYHLKYLTAIGGSSSIENFDLNNLNHVKARIEDFEKALTEKGFGAWQNQGGKFQFPTLANKHGKIKAINIKYMSLKQLRTIDLSKIGDKDVREAFKQYINMREHGETLKSAQELMSNMRMRITQGIRKILGDSDLSNAIGQIQSQYRNVQFAIKAWGKVGKFIQWAGKFAVKNRLWVDKVVKRFMSLDKTNGAARYQKYLSGKHSGQSKKTRYDAKQQKRAERAKIRKDNASKKAQTKKGKLSKGKKGGKRVAKRAGKLQSKLIGKAGKQGSNAVRAAGRLAAHGAQGTTAAAGATGTAAAGAGATGTAAAGAAGGAGGAAGGAAGAAGGAGAGYVILWIILIALIVSAACQLISGVLQVICSTVTDFDNTLLGKMANWIADFKWPWEASDEDKENVLYYTMYLLINEDTMAKTGSTALGELTFNTGCAPFENGKNNPTYVLKQTGDSGIYWHQWKYTAADFNESNTYYLYTNAATGDPINEYSSIKLCLSMAHAFTYNIETKKQIEDFSLYAVGLWRHLNKTTVKATLELCPGCIYDGTTYYYEYYCDDAWECPKEGCETQCSHKKAHWVSSFAERFWSRNTDRYYPAGTLLTIHAGMNEGDAAQLYIVTPGLSHAIMAPTADGCVRTTHNNSTGQYMKTDTKNAGNGKSWTTDSSGLTTLSAYKPEALDSLPEQKASDKTYLDSKGNLLKWTLNPEGVKSCFQSQQLFLGSDSRYKICNSSELATCANSTTITKYKEQEGATTYHGTYFSGGNSINNGDTYCANLWLSDSSSGSWKDDDGTSHSHRHTSIKLYYCDGSKHHGQACYCATGTIYTYTRTYDSAQKKYVYTYDGYDKAIKNASYEAFACSQRSSVKKYVYYNGSYQYKTIYYCNGHTGAHGYFTSDSPYYTACREFKWVEPIKDKDGNVTREGYWNKTSNGGWKEVKTRYICTGYKPIKIVANGTLKVCLGHLICSTHLSCPGHHFNYCNGHMKFYIERTTTTAESEAIYSNSWTYTVTGKFLWWDTSETYAPKKKSETSHTALARNDWEGWTDNNKELMQTVYMDDWYRKYGIGMGSFVGSQCSAYEAAKLKENYAIDVNTTTAILMQNLDTALGACGKICYYPGGRAYYEGMDPRNKFNTTTTEKFDKNNIRRAVYGLDPQYFADWVYRTTHGNKALPVSVTQFDNAVTSHTTAGMPIANTSDPNNIRSGILIGTYTVDGTTYVKYVGLDTGTNHGGGWVTILDEPITGWKYSVQAQT